MADIIKIMKDGVVQYPITKPECVIDENGKNVLQLIRENAGGDPYDDTEIKKDIAELSGETEVLKEAQQFTDVAIKDLQDMKIDRENDDYYPKMAVGLADNLAGVDVVDSEINFRRSGGGAITDGVARIETIKGNSVVWNQFMDYGRAISNNKTMAAELVNGKISGYLKAAQAANSITFPTVTPSGNYYRAIIGHKYMWFFSSNNASSRASVGDKYDLKSGVVIEAASNGYCYFYPFGGYSTIIEANTSVEFSAAFYDLTQMFGSGNEPTTIEEFYARIPLGVDLNAYNEGEVIHMDVQSIESVGVNQWDEEWEDGQISTSTGRPTDLVGIRSKNFIEVFPNVKYYGFAKSKFLVIYYDEQYNFVDWWGVDPYRELTIPSNVHYIKLTRQQVTTYDHDIIFNLSDTAINGKYYPHIKRVEDLSIIRKYFPDGMKSAGSAHDEIRYNNASGKREKVQRIMKVDAGTLAWAQDTYNGKTIFKAYIVGAIGPSSQATKGAILCPRYSVITAAGLDTQDKTIASYYVAAGYECQVPVYDSAYTDLASFKASVQGVDIYAEMHEPLITELDKEDQLKDLDYQVWNAGTEKASAEGKSAPLAADITYGFNAIGKIKELESLVAQLRTKVGI